MKYFGAKLLNIIFLLIVGLTVYLPLIFMNHETNVESLIDNRFLNEWDGEADPFYPMLNDYVNDRIGFRSDMLKTQMIVKDRLFFEPNIVRGKDGYIFPNYDVEHVDYEFLDRFGQYLGEVKRICDDRSIPFLFMLNPIKTSIYPDKLPNGYHYHRLHPQAIEDMLNEYNIPYISTYYNLKALADQSINVYNIEYDQNHWNDLGMIHGVNVLLDALQNFGLKVKLNELKDFSYTTTMKYLATMPPFPIKEEIHVYSSNLIDSYDSMKDEYEFTDEIMREKCLGIFLNPNLTNEEAERILIYQGSYMNRKVSITLSCGVQVKVKQIPSMFMFQRSSA